MSRPARCPPAVLFLALLMPVAAPARSGFVTYAVPVESLTVDGRLDDWPAQTMACRLEAVLEGNAGYDGDPPDTSDLRAAFRTAWSPTRQQLYVALVVHDDRVTLGSGSNQTDACELYLDADGESGPQPIQQFLLFPGAASYDAFGTGQNPTLRGGDIAAAGARGCWSVDGDSITYEWSLGRRGGGAEGALRAGARVGLDLVAVDKDDPARGPTWLSWSPGPSKYDSPQNVGEAVLLPSAEALARLPRLRVRLVQPGTEVGWRGLRVAALDGDSTVAAAVSGPGGWLELRVPPGDLRLVVADAEPPAARTLSCAEGEEQEVALPVAGVRGTQLPRWPFAISLGLFVVAAAVAIFVLYRRAPLLGGILVRPGEAFGLLAKQPEWSAPVGLALAAATLIAGAEVNLLPGQLWGAMLGMPGALASALVATVPLFVFVADLVVVFAGWLAWTACLWAAARLAGHPCRLVPLASITGYAGLPWLLGVCLAAVATAWGWQHASPDLSQLTGLGLWATGDTPLDAMLAHVEGFTLWTAVLGAVGTRRLVDASRRRAALLNAICWGLYLAAVYGVHAVSRALTAALAAGGS